MRVKIELEANETIESAEEFLEKSLEVKKECSEERYTDNYLNDFIDMILTRHSALVHSTLEEISEEIRKDANGNGYL